MSELWYQQPAATWNEALPLGNGRLGAMVHGRTETEMIQLNEATVWFGGPQKRAPEDALSNLPALRKAIREGNHIEAERLVTTYFFSNPSSQRHYEPLGNLFLDFGHKAEHVTKYRRSLDLTEGVLHVNYEHQGVCYGRQMTATDNPSVLILRLRSSAKAEFTLRLARMSDLEYESQEYHDWIETIGEDQTLRAAGLKDNTITMHVTPGGEGSNRACCVLHIQTLDKDNKGAVTKAGKNLVVRSADAVIYIAARTSICQTDYKTDTMSDIAKLDPSPVKVWDEQVRNNQEIWARMHLQLSPDRSDIPTDKRLAESRDPGLVALYHNYSRYLLRSCSYEGDATYPLPANLQGIWNASFHPAWGCRFTININIQMNYWSAHPCNLSECELPLFTCLERLAHNGRNTAKKMYGCSGWTAHSNTDIWADTDPVDRWMPGTLWPLGGAWLCCHLWEHFQFTGREDILRKYFMVLRGCVEFLLDFLIEDSDGKYLTTSPSLSPENSYYDKIGQKGVFCEGSTIDIQIIDTVLRDFESTTTQLRIDDELLPQVRETRTRLPPMTISKNGYLQEWAEDYNEVEPGHRHTSHLWGLYPGNSITLDKTPALAAACRETLRRRAQHGGGHTGWSRAWLINLFARLRDAEECQKHLDLLLAQSTLPNLFDSHPPFQIDGNFGGAAGIVEMLIQSHESGVIRLLPACPRDWSGSIHGVRARGGFDLGFSFENGCIVGDVAIESLRGEPVTVNFPGEGGFQKHIDRAGHYTISPRDYSS
ncbi:hypothetical protein N7493_005380 [Penicillium malachiteum]|uniref:Glycosyl hydrolase family 95 N-terminal domain-containing protein n=1 Tax=Penicillium malachiteum TaxID=1324776 RepID=A0AAD6MWG3_9EURO|nr:hypothetical protein N7493_005380 [Penicillium malachiteum]